MEQFEKEPVLRSEPFDFNNLISNNEDSVKALKGAAVDLLKAINVVEDKVRVKGYRLELCELESQKTWGMALHIDPCSWYEYLKEKKPSEATQIACEWLDSKNEDKLFSYRYKPPQNETRAFNKPSDQLRINQNNGNLELNTNGKWKNLCCYECSTCKQTFNSKRSKCTKCGKNYEYTCAGCNLIACGACNNKLNDETTKKCHKCGVNDRSNFICKNASCYTIFHQNLILRSEEMEAYTTFVS